VEALTYLEACSTFSRASSDIFKIPLFQTCAFPSALTESALLLCAGAQWEKASEVFEQMQTQGCTPDVVTFTALISSFEKGGQWRRALGAYEQMRLQRCKPDAIVYNAIIDTLWETGVIWAQRKVRGCLWPSLA
jgi:pentatricopeptide repeat protein